MILNLNRGAFGPNSFTYTGEYEFQRSGADWMLWLKTSGTLRLRRPVGLADLALVAGGEKGNTDGNSCGGDGGEVLTPTPLLLPAGEYSVTVGASGQNTVLTGPGGLTYTARTGEGSAGGDAKSTGTTGNPGSAGTLLWGDASTLICTGWRFGPGGGAGGWTTAQDSGPTGGLGGDLGAAPVPEGTYPGRGGMYGKQAGSAGLANTGQGGGGGATNYYTGGGVSTGTGAGGNGGSGSLFIRAHKEVAA